MGWDLRVVVDIKDIEHLDYPLVVEGLVYFDFAKGMPTNQGAEMRENSI